MTLASTNVAWKIPPVIPVQYAPDLSTLNGNGGLTCGNIQGSQNILLCPKIKNYPCIYQRKTKNRTDETKISEQKQENLLSYKMLKSVNFHKFYFLTILYEKYWIIF